MGFKVEGAASSDAQKFQDPAEKLQQLSVVVARQRYVNRETGFFIAEGVPEAGPQVVLPQEFVGLDAARLVGAGRPVTIRGMSQLFVETDPIGSTLQCHGTWVMDPAYGLQFDVNHIEDVVPTTPSALQKYLGSGRLKGIGPATAREMVSRWGVDVLRILDHTPERLTEISGITPTKAKAIAETWQEKRRFYRLVSFLGQYGIGEGRALKIQEALGAENLEHRLRANPYELTQVEGIGFKIADQVALAMGMDRTSPTRINAALAHILHEKIQQAGHTAVPAREWVAQAQADLGCSLADTQRHCQSLIDSGKVLYRDLRLTVAEKRGEETAWVTRDVACVSPVRIAQQENLIAKDLLRLAETVDPMAADESEVAQQMLDDPERNLDPSQRAAAWTSLNAPFSIITGGPGTGKTTTLRSIVDVCRRLGRRIVLAAPTGRAAQRMKEATGEEAKTMHRALEYKQGLGFQRHRTNPMEGDVFVLDESSMVDTSMAAHWLAAIPMGARVIWVGDADQLPSVGPGDVLRNLIESKSVPVSTLRKVHRQAEGSGIAQNAARVREGQPPVFEGNPWTDDFSFIRADDNEVLLKSLEELVDGYLALGYRAQDIQVLTPQRTGAVGVESLNHILRWKLNPENPIPVTEEEGGGARFQLGERVLQTKNNYQLEVFNGDLGTVIDIKNDGGLKVEMEDGRKVDYAKKDTSALQYGYAITVHKSQGGERPIILLVCSPSHTHMLNRNLIYTGITRGKQRVVMVGSPRTAVIAARKKDELVRATGLVFEIARVNGLARKATPRPASRGP